MKTNRGKNDDRERAALKEAVTPFGVEASMVRTQIYLTRAEHTFLQSEAVRRNEPMSAVIRSIIDEKMTLPEDAWANNPLLEPTPKIRGWKGDEDGALNHDHYVYGGPKKYHKVDGEWVPISPDEM